MNNLGRPGSLRVLESALRTNAYEGDGELDGYSEDDTGSQGLPQGPYVMGRQLSQQHHDWNNSDDGSRGRFSHHARSRFDPRAPLQPRNYFQPSTQNSHSPVRTGRRAGHHPYPVESRVQSGAPDHDIMQQRAYSTRNPAPKLREWSAPEDEGRLAQDYLGDSISTPYGRGVQSDLGLHTRSSSRDVPIHDRDAYSAGNTLRTSQYSIPHGEVSSLDTTRYKSASTNSRQTARPADTTTPMDVISRSGPSIAAESTHSSQYPNPAKSGALFVYSGTRYPETPHTNQVYSNQHLRDPARSSFTPQYEYTTSTGPSVNSPAPFVVAIPPYIEPTGSLHVARHIADQTPASTSLQKSSERIVRPPIKIKVQSSAMSMKMFTRDIQLAFLAGFISGAFLSPGICENTNYGEGFHEAVKSAYQAGLTCYRNEPNRGVLNMTVGGEASFETMREDIPGQAIVKMNASLIDLLQDGIGTYYPHMQRPLSNVLGSWQELKRTVEVATMYLGPSGQNSFLHTVSPEGFIMRYQHPGFAAFIKAFLFRHALSLGNGFMAAFNPLTACTITYCAIMLWYEYKCIGDNKTRPIEFPPLLWRDCFAMVLAEVTDRLRTDPSLIAFAERVPREGRSEYVARESATATEMAARAQAKADAAKLAAAATAAEKKQKKKRMPPKSAPFSSSLDDALGKSVPRSS